MERIAEETPAPDHEADFHGPEAAFPVVGCGGAVASEPTADGDGVEELEESHAEAENGVHGRHAGVEEEGGEYRAVEVVDYLRTG